MLPKFTDENIRDLILSVRESGKIESLLPNLSIWMVYKVSKKRRLSEDDKSDLMVSILENLPRIWFLSKPYADAVVAGFFVTYAFNLFRNYYRNNHKSKEKIIFLELWQDRKEQEQIQTIFEEEEGEAIIKHLNGLPPLTGLVICLKLDLPILKHHRKFLEWRLVESGHKYVDFEASYDKRKELLAKKLNLMESRVLRYTRLLLDEPISEKRPWYSKKKKEWVLQRERTMSKSLFTEDEIARIVGLSRKQIRWHYLRGIKTMQWQGKDLLHCA